MKSKIGCILVVVVLVLLVSAALCYYYFFIIGDGSTSSSPIGTIAAIQTRVEAGQGSDINEVSGSRDFYDNESVRVKNKGKGRINFNDGSEVTFYNDTSTDNIVANFSPPEIKLLLTEQGFQGYVPHGSKFTVDMPNSVTVTILGTQFFVVFEPATGYTTIGNYDGTVRFTPPGGPEQNLPPRTMADIGPDGRVDFYNLPYDPGTFDSAADDAGAPVEGMKRLRREFEQPMPGEIIPTEAPVPATVIRFLVTTSDNQTFFPDLATDWTTDPDGYIIEFHLRQDVSLPDGSPFTSSYVRDRLEKEWQYVWNGGVKFELVDDYTIRFILSSPSINYVLQEMSKFGFEVRQ